jgi:hypothetical protein
MYIQCGDTRMARIQQRNQHTAKADSFDSGGNLTMLTEGQAYQVQWHLAPRHVNTPVHRLWGHPRT